MSGGASSRRRFAAAWLAGAGIAAAALAGAARAGAAPSDPDDGFFHAIAVDDASTLSGMLAHGADPNRRDPRGQVALYAALRDGSSRCARVLLAAPALEADAVNEAGETPLMMAALRGDEDAARALLARGAAAHRPGWSPLHYAASGGHPSLVRLFLGLGAPVDARSPRGDTPLMMAARYGGSETAEVLLQAGADRALVNDRGRDAAAEADAGGSDGVARWLREWHPPKPTTR